MSRIPTPPVITGIRPGSLAEAAGIRPGDRLLEIAGRAPRDVIDVQFFAAEPEVEVRIETAEGVQDLLVFEKDIDEDLGLEFDRATWDEVTLCNNNCFFCFLKGLPKGMRKTLYVKDDDYRLSFLHGNFVTLTNLDESDWGRLAEQRLSPLNVSVHATDLALRRRMLANPDAPDILEQLDRLGTLGLRAHTQIVLCPGVNDGASLDRSLHDLVSRYPTVQTVSVVPVGASPKLETWSVERDGIELVRPSPGYARAVLAQVRPYQREARRRHGATVVQCSDEYYVVAGETVPSRATYDGFPQYENGIGMVRTMLDDWARTRRRLRGHPLGARFGSVVIGCGTLAAAVLQPVAREFAECTGVSCAVVPIENSVFGERVNVSGLLCGQDFVRALAGRRPDCFVLPRASLDYFGRHFLDSMTVEEAEDALGAPLAFASRWSEVARIVARGPAAPAVNAAPNGAFWSEPAVPSAAP